MGKSLKEALLEQLDTLRERGLAPHEVPVEEESSLVVFDERSAGDMSDQRGRPARRARPKGPAARPGAPRPQVFGGMQRNGAARHQDDRDDRDGGRRDRRPRPMRPARQTPPLGTTMPVGPAPLAGPPPRPQPGSFAPRPQPANFAPPPGRSALLQQRAEQRRREQEQEGDVRGALEAVRGEPLDDEGYQQFMNDLAAETGALPPLNVVFEAVRAANSLDVRAVGDQVRAYYRRPRVAIAAGS